MTPAMQRTASTASARWTGKCRTWWTSAAAASPWSKTAFARAPLTWWQASVTLRRRAGSADWSTVRAVLYAYYDGAEAHGNLGDLETAVLVDAGGNALDTRLYWK